MLATPLGRGHMFKLLKLYSTYTRPVCVHTAYSGYVHKHTVTTKTLELLRVGIHPTVVWDSNRTSTGNAQATGLRGHWEIRGQGISEHRDREYLKQRQGIPEHRDRESLNIETGSP